MERPCALWKLVQTLTPKVWTEKVTESITFYGQKDPAGKSHLIDLDDAGECIIRVRGLHSSIISKLEITTNFGRTFKIGHDYPLQMDPVY